MENCEVMVKPSNLQNEFVTERILSLIHILLMLQTLHENDVLGTILCSIVVPVLLPCTASPLVALLFRLAME